MKTRTKVVHKNASQGCIFRSEGLEVKEITKLLHNAKVHFRSYII